MNKKVKTFAIIAIIIAAGFAAYTYLGGDSSTGNSTGGSLSSSVIPGGSNNSVGNGAAANEFSSLLSSIKSINIDTNIFQDPGFKALRDYPVVLGTDLLGRINPFAPIGRDAGASVQRVEVQTLTPAKITANTAESGASVTIPMEGLPVSVMLQYDTNDTFSLSTQAISVSKSGTTLIPLNNLLPGTRYYVRAVVTQGSTTTTGNTMNFVTLAQQ